MLPKLEPRCRGAFRTCKTPEIGVRLAAKNGPQPALLEGVVALKLSVKSINGVTVVYCSGRIVFGEEAADLRERVKEMLATIRQVVLNLGGVSYIDSGGLGTLVGLYTSARAVGGEIKLANLTQRVRDQLQITKLVTVFEVFDSEEKAVESFAQRASA